MKQEAAQHEANERGLQDEDRVRMAYDQAAWVYDNTFTRRLDRAEDEYVGRLLLDGYLSGDVLDVGCGTGLLLDLCSVDPERYRGVDLSPVMVRVAKRKHPDHRFSAANMEDMSAIPRARFDSVVNLFGSFSHSMAPSATLSETWRVLRPGGRFFLMALGKRYETRRSYIMREQEDVPTLFWDAASLHDALVELFDDVKVQGMSSLMDGMPGWLPQWFFHAWVRLEMKTIGRLAPDACYFLIATATKGD